MKAPWIERIVLVLAMAVAWYSWSAKQNAQREALIATENALAAQDTVRVLRIGKDGARAAYVEALQQAQVTLRSAEARLAKAERLQAKLRADLAVAVRGIDTVYTGHTIPIMGTIGPDSGSLRDSLTLTGPPITGHVTADLNPSRPTRWGVQLRPDPIPLTVIVGCRKVGPPETLITGPSWVTIVPHGVIDPSVCHPKKGGGWLTNVLIGVGVGILGWEIAR